MLEKAWPAEYTGLSFYNFYQGMADKDEKMRIPAFFVTAIGKMAETCNIAESLMKTAVTKFNSTSLYTPEVLSEADLKVLTSAQLLDPDYVWPAFFDLHSKQLDIWGSITRPISPDTYSGYLTGLYTDNMINDKDYRSCYIGPVEDEDFTTELTAEFDNPLFGMEITREAANSLFYDTVLVEQESNFGGDVCGDSGEVVTFIEKLYCNSYRTFLEFPLKKLTSELVGLCKAGEAQYRTTMNEYNPGYGDMIIMTGKMGKDTPKELIANMMLASKPGETLAVDHAAHYAQCAPASCTYIESEKATAATIFGIIVGVYGGFHAIAMTFIFPLFVFPLFCMATGAMSFAEMRAGVISAAVAAGVGAASDAAQGVATDTADKVAGTTV